MLVIVVLIIIKFMKFICEIVLFILTSLRSDCCCGVVSGEDVEARAGNSKRCFEFDSSRS